MRSELMQSNLRVRDLMTRPVRTLGRNDKLSVADALMRTEGSDIFRLSTKMGGLRE